MGQGSLVWAHICYVSPNEGSYYADAYHCVYHAKYVEQTEYVWWWGCRYSQLSSLPLPSLEYRYLAY